MSYPGKNTVDHIFQGGDECEFAPLIESRVQACGLDQCSHGAIQSDG